MLNNASQTATTAGEEIAGGLTRLLSEIEGAAPAFQGAAGSTFQNVSVDLGNELRRILDALNRMANAVNVSNKTYADTDEGANQEISKAAAQYGGSGVVNALRG
jgi:WXG100 family type VII secretion target